MILNTRLMISVELLSQPWSCIHRMTKAYHLRMQNESPRKSRLVNSMKCPQILISFGLGDMQVTSGKSGYRFSSREAFSFSLISARQLYTRSHLMAECRRNHRTFPRTPVFQP